MIDSNPKSSFQVLAAWYMRCAEVNLPLAWCKMEELEAKYTMLYQATQPTGVTENVPKGHFQRLLAVALRMSLTLYLLLYGQSM